MDRVDEIIDGVLLWEGGFINHPADRGGATNWGVTLSTLQAEGQFFDLDFDDDGDVDTADVRLLPREAAHALLKRRYVERPRLDLIVDPLLLELAVDASVNHGPKMAVQLLQRALKLRDDGQFGPITQRALRAAEGNSREIQVLLLAERLAFYGQIVSRDPQLRSARAAGFRLQAEFAAGWNNRVAELLRAVA